MSENGAVNENFTAINFCNNHNHGALTYIKARHTTPNAARDRKNKRIRYDTIIRYDTTEEFLPRDALLCKARYCDRMSSVCPSVCPSVTLVDSDHIGWNSSKLISPVVSLHGMFALATPT